MPHRCHGEHPAQLYRSWIRLQVEPEILGISGAMNATIARARGRYLAIPNSDDWALPGRLQRQVDFLAANPAVRWCLACRNRLTIDGAPADRRVVRFRPAAAVADFSRRTWLRRVPSSTAIACARRPQ